MCSKDGQNKIPRAKSSADGSNSDMTPHAKSEQHQDDNTESQGCCTFFRYDHNKEARAIALTSAASSCIIISGMFLSTAVLQLARNQAASMCQPTGGADAPPCDPRVYAIKASSLLTMIATLSGVISAVVMPVTGAIIDHTNQRKNVAIVTAVILTIINCVQMMISEQTWFIVSILMAVNTVFYLMHVTAIFAYLRDLTEDAEKLTRYNSSYEVIKPLSSTFTLVITMVIARVLPGIGEQDELSYIVATARISQVFQFVYTVPFFFFAFYNGLQPRRALSQVPANSNLFTTGFKKLFGTVRDIVTNHRTLAWFIVGNILIQSVASSVTVTFLTYVTTFLLFDGMETAQSILLFLITSVVGSRFVGPLARVMGSLLTLLKVACVIGGIFPVLMTVLIAGPEQAKIFYLLLLGQGFSFGIVVPAARLVYLNIMPRGQETEMMGIYTFSSYGFLWLVPLIITIMNENGYSIRYGMSVMGGLSFAAVLAYFMMGSYEKAVELVSVPTCAGEDIKEDPEKGSEPKQASSSAPEVDNNEGVEKSVSVPMPDIPLRL